MVSSSSYKLPLLAFTIYLSALVAAKPYAPDLYSRSSLADDGIIAQRQISASRPYAPDLYARNSVDPIQIVKRSPSPIASLPSSSSSSWFNMLSKRSEEEMHSRGMISDDIFTKRGQCSEDSECGNKYYCSSKKNTCYKKLDIGKHCTRNGACDSSYCSNSSNTCQNKRSTGAQCGGNNSACSSGYCSVRSSTCKPVASYGGSCIVDAGCSGSLSCVNQSCTGSTGWTGNGNGNGKGHGNGNGSSKGGNGGQYNNGNGHGNGNGSSEHGHGKGSPTTPSNPSPSGSHNHKRELKMLV